MKLMVFLLLLTAQSAGLAESKISQGDYELHFTTFPSTFLPRKVATTHQIKRSKVNGILSLTLLDTKNSPPTATEAKITIKAQNLLGQSKTVNIKTIKESDQAIYYLGMFTMNNRETVRFTIAATTADKQTINHTFTRQFFTD